METIKPLTSIRFAFAVLVVLFHGAPWLYPAASTGPVAPLVTSGFVGVQLFFALSGFILAYTYQRLDTPASRRSFWRARVARVYPVYILGLLLVLPIQVYAIVRRDADAAAIAVNGLLQVSLLQAWVPTAAMSWNPPGWSLSVEAFFYTLFPFILGRMATWGTRRAALAALAAFAFTVGISAYASSAIAGVPPASYEFWHHLAAYNPLAHLASFLCGIVACLVYQRSPQVLARHSNAILAISAAAIVVTLWNWTSLPALVVHNGLLAPAASALFAALASNRGIAARILSLSPLVLLGQASYALYVIHVPVLVWLQIYWRSHGRPDASPLALLSYVAAVSALSIVVFRWYEEPLRRLIRQRPGHALVPGASRA